MSLAMGKSFGTLRSVTAHHVTFLRWTIVLLTISAWLLASNHCAVAGVTGHHASLPRHADATNTGHAHCPGSSREKDDDESDTLCCSSLQATVAQPAKSLAAFDPITFVPVAYFLLPLILIEEQASAVSTEMDTGPPGESSFAELVLQRSILAHAPPVLV